VFDVPVRDPLTYLVVAIALAIVALAACVIPARKASRVDPMVALRCD
jgi:putative ABC transport system permease protein